MSVTERFILFLKKIGHHGNDVSKNCNIPQSTVSAFLSGTVKHPRVNIIESIGQYYTPRYGLNMNYIILDIEPMQLEVIQETVTEESLTIKAIPPELDILKNPTVGKLVNIIESQQDIIRNQQHSISEKEKEIKRLSA